MSIHNIIDLLNKKHVHILEDISKAQKIVYESEVKKFFNELKSIGVHELFYVENGKVKFSFNGMLLGEDIDLEEFESLSEVGKYKIAKQLFGDPELRNFKSYRISGNSAFILVFSIDIPTYRLALVDLIMNSKVFQFKLEGNFLSKLKTTLGFIYRADKETYMHSYRTKEYAKYIAINLGIEGMLLKQIKIGAFLHDIGKLFIPVVVLKKEGKLTKDEFDLIKSHSYKSYEILKSFGFDGCILDIALLHHEKIDGSGYPYGVKNIPLCVQIVEVADILDAIQSSRIYKDKMGLPVLKRELNKLKGKLDEKVVKAAISFVKTDKFFALKNRFLKVSSRYFSSYSHENINDLIQKINLLKEENINLAKELDLYKKITEEVQAKYERVVSECDRFKRPNRVSEKVDFSLDLAFRLASKAGSLRTIVLFENNKICSIKGESIAFEDVLKCVKSEQDDNFEIVDIGNSQKLCLIFESKVKLNTSLRLAISGLF